MRKASITKELYVPSVRELIDNAAAKYGDRTFIEYLSGDTLVEKSFNQVRDDSLAVCRYLRNISTEKMHIALVSGTSYEYLVFATGVLISGNVLIPFGPDISEHEASSLFPRADVSMIFHDNGFADKVSAVAEKLEMVSAPVNIAECDTVAEIIGKYSADSEYASLADYEVDDDALALMIFTSGTTGVRKGVMHSTKSIMANVMHTPYVNYVDEDSVVLSVLPMYHVFCFTGDFLNNLKDGATVAINNNMRDLTASLKAFQPDVMRVVPMVAQTLLKMVKATMVRNPSMTHRQAAECVYGKNIKWLLSGGAYLSPELVSEYQQYGIYLRQGYGMTEAGCRITVPALECSTESVGKVVDICNVRIKGGEIQINTPSVMLGYYKMPKETAEVFTEDGWLRTGDIGVLTDERELFVTGRLKNLLILSSGENVSPEAIEKKFSSYEEISEILVYAESDRLIADIYPNYDYLEDNRIDNPTECITSIVKQLNSVSKPSHVIAQVKIRKTPLERTDNGKIRRKVNVL